MNMNAMGDDHVSFSASHLAASPCNKYLLVSTEGSRIIMFRIKGTAAQSLQCCLRSSSRRAYACSLSADWTQARNFYGLSVEEKFHQPCAAWHRSGFYVFAAAAAGTVSVFHVGTTKVCLPTRSAASNFLPSFVPITSYKFPRNTYPWVAKLLHCHFMCAFRWRHSSKLT